MLEIVIPLLTIAILVIIILNLVQGRSQWTQAFEKLAERYGGWYHSAKLTRPPVATFKYKDAECRIRCRRIGRNRSTKTTEMRIAWPQVKPLTMEIVPVSHSPQLRGLRSSEPMTTEDAAFDEIFHVFVGKRKPQNARRLLSSGVRWQVQQLGAHLGSVPIRITIDRGWLTIRKYVYIKSAEDLDDFARFCLELFDQFTLTLSEGIEFREDVVMTAVEQLQCPICSSDIEGQMVVCVRCKTPHCLDCWQYNTKCGMYACDEGRYMLVGSGQQQQQ
ncbi:MAG: hypothetical protein ACR2NP_20795 [Pirellulaceae bacterium]